MDVLAVIRAVGGLATVLGLLVGAVWLMRRYKLAWPGIGAGRQDARLQVVERLAIDQRRSVLLIRRDGHEHLILLGPEAPLLIEAGIRLPVPGPDRSIAPTSFASILENTRRQAVRA